MVARGEAVSSEEELAALTAARADAMLVDESLRDGPVVLAEDDDPVPA
jgi:hypothetical protein